MGRPRIKVDWNKVEQMCAIQCTGEEIAGVLGIDYDTLNSACKRENKLSFSDYFKQKGSVGKMSLRRKQYTSMMEGNTTMMVWLGKNWLGQSDKEMELSDEPAPLNITFNVSEPKSDIKVTRGK